MPCQPIKWTMYRGICAINVRRVAVLMISIFFMRVDEEIPIMRSLAFLKAFHRIDNIIPLIFR